MLFERLLVVLPHFSTFSFSWCPIVLCLVKKSQFWCHRRFFCSQDGKFSVERQTCHVVWFLEVECKLGFVWVFVVLICLTFSGAVQWFRRSNSRSWCRFFGRDRRISWALKPWKAWGMLSPGAVSQASQSRFVSLQVENGTDWHVRSRLPQLSVRSGNRILMKTGTWNGCRNECMCACVSVCGVTLPENPVQCVHFV